MNNHSTKTLQMTQSKQLQVDQHNTNSPSIPVATGDLMNNVSTTAQQRIEVSTNFRDGTNKKTVRAFEYALKRLSYFEVKSNRQLLSNVCVLCDVFMCILSVFFCIMFVILEANTFWEYTNSIFVSMASVVCLISILLLTANSTKVFKLCENIQKIIEGRINCSAKLIYSEAIEQIERWSEIADFTLARCFPYAFMLPKFFLSYFKYFTTDSGPNAFELTFPIWVPYDWKNPIAYAITTLLSFVGFQKFLSFLGLAAALAIGALLFGIAVIRDMKMVLKSTNDNVIAGQQNKLQMLRKLNEFIEIHAMIKEKILDASKIVEPFTAVIYASSFVSICCAMLMIQMELENNNNGNSSLMLLIALGYGLNSFGLVFITCEFSQRGCDAVNSFDFEIGQIDWYLCPIEMKKMLPTIMNMAQKPVAIKGFGTMAADRELFKKIVNKAYSFFMVLRKFSK